MYLSAERLALANRTVKETFEQSSVAWQAIPHWDTGDPTRTQVRSDRLPGEDAAEPAAKAPAKKVAAKAAPEDAAEDAPEEPAEPAPKKTAESAAEVAEFVDLFLAFDPFEVTLAEAISPTPDAVLAKVIAATVNLAGKVDDAVFPALLAENPHTAEVTETSDDGRLNGLIAARATVEKHGYRSPSCLVTNTAGLKLFSKIIDGVPGTGVLLTPANINSLHRAEKLADDNKVRGLLLGRRRRIAHGGAAEASPGAEPVDLAVSVPPGLELVGETNSNMIRLRVRMCYALRLKDKGGLVVLRIP